jgi:hypothetical protein
MKKVLIITALFLFTINNDLLSDEDHLFLEHSKIA